MQPFIEQPEFVLQPKSSFVFENHPVQLECQAIHARQIFFNCDNKWVPEQEHIKSNETDEKGNLIIITKIQLTSDQMESNTYKCFCQAWSATGGTLKSRIATIELAYLDKIFEWEPLKTESVISKSTELRCRPPHGNPYPKITWMKDNQPVEINRNGRFILSNENSLLIAQIKKSDSGNYTCIATNIAGSYTSEPAELVVHDDRGWSDWQSFSECKGVPCSTGRQRRVRTCLNPPTVNNRPSCDGDQMQERECQVPCIKPKSTDEIYSVWTEWSTCLPPDCVSRRTRECLQGSCENLIETRSCKKTICSFEQIRNNNNNNNNHHPHSLASIVYPSVGIGAAGVLLFLILFAVFICYRRQRRRLPTKKGLSTKTACNTCHIEKNDYPFYYTIQQDTTSTRSNNSITLTNSEFAFERDKFLALNDSPSKSNQLTNSYEKILRSLPDNLDLKYLTISILNRNSLFLEIAHTGISLTIPEDAVLSDNDQLIYVALLYTDNHMPILNSNQTRLSPVILIGPSDITLVKPIVLSFEHTARLDSSWKYHLMHTDNLFHWKTILTVGEENISTPVYLQFHNDQQGLILLESMGTYALIGECQAYERALKSYEIACFYNQSSLRIRFFDRTSDAYERCLNEEFQLNSRLCDQPSEFLLSNIDEQICFNLDLELSPTSNLNLGYKDIPLELFLTNQIHRSVFIFHLPNNEHFFLQQFILHINVYQPKLLDYALHTRLIVNTAHLQQNSVVQHRFHSKSQEKIPRLPKILRERLCQILDPPTSLGNDWRMFASNLLGINYLQYFASKSSPTEHLLTVWDARQESLVHMINVLNQIGRSDAACIILTHMNITH